MQLDEKNKMRLTAWFDTYVRDFFVDGRLPPMQQLKYDHCRRVAENAAAIGAAQQWDEGALRLAWIAGLLHDTGRFSQYRDFGTFADLRSVNHACRGAAELRRLKVLNACEPQVREWLLTAVGLHNCREIPADLDENSTCLLHLVRDADKLDIFEVVDDAFRHDRLRLYPEIVLQVDLTAPPSPDVLAAVREQRSVGYASIRALPDFLLVMLNWIYAFHYPAALNLARARRVVSRLAEHLPDFPEKAELLAPLLQFGASGQPNTE